MKTKLFLLMALSAFLFLGCSTDNQEDSFYDSSNSRLSEDNVAARQVTRPFKSKASGDWFINLNPQEYVCDGLLQYSIVGTGNATHMGKINILGTLCTFPPEGIYILEVTFTGANGDSITWRSGDDVFINEQGLYAGAVFDCVAGTGHFEDASGQITVDDFLVPTEFDNTFEPPLPVAGTFSNMSLGTITY
jgi:hypothetical protein